MSSSNEIKALRKAERLDEALILALNEYEKCPVSVIARNDLAWVYDALCKRSASQGDINDFQIHFQSLILLGVLPNDRILSETLCWRFRTLLAEGTSRLDATLKATFSQQAFEMAKALASPMPSEAYSVLCKAFYQQRENWTGFLDFMEWWGWNTFRAEDYQCEKLPNGKRMPISSAEGCYIAYAKLLLQTDDRERINSFLPLLEALGEAHPEMMYPGYYVGKLLMATGGSHEAMLHSVLPFVRRKQDEFWAWQLLAEIMRNDEQTYMSCLLRAADSKTMDNFLIKILYLLTTLLVARQDYVGAKYFLLRYVKAKQSIQSYISSEVNHWLESEWFQKASTRRSESPFLSMDYRRITEQLLFADIAETPLYVTHVAAEKRIAHVIYGFEQRGHIRYPRKMQETLRQGLILFARIDPRLSHDGYLECSTLRHMKKEESTTCNFIRNVDGVITSNKSRTAFFVKFGEKFAFIPPEVLKGRAIEVGLSVSATVVRDYHKAKDRWNWRCVRII